MKKKNEIITAIKKINTLNKFVLLSVLLLSVESAYAGDSDIYAGFTYGLTSAELEGTNDVDIIEQLDVSGSHPFGLHLGYDVNDVLSLEAGVRYYGENKYSFSGEHLGKIKPTTFSLSANIGYDFVSGLRPYITVGGVFSKVDSSGDIGLDSNSQMGLRYGLGLDYIYSSMKNITWKLAYEVENITLETSSLEGGDKMNFNFELKSLYAGISYNF